MHLNESHSFAFLISEIDRENRNVEKSVLLSIAQSCRENHLMDRDKSYTAVKPAQFWPISTHHLCILTNENFKNSTIIKHCNA